MVLDKALSRRQLLRIGAGGAVAVGLAPLGPSAVLAAPPEVLWSLLRPAAARTWDQLSVDGDTSTNDTVFVLASGAAAASPVGAGSDAAGSDGTADAGGPDAAASEADAGGAVAGGPGAPSAGDRPAET